jgi:signal transduction histidine kinase/CheY-like chemotaxis protein
MARPASQPTTPLPAESAALEGPLPLDSIQRDKLSLIGHMASSIAHELSNPLATIIATSEAILSFWPRPGSTGLPGTGRENWNIPPEYQAQGVPLRQLRDDLELVLQEARRAGDIVHGLLGSARQAPPEWRICSVADVVRRTVGLSRHHLKLHNISLQAPYFDPHEGYPLWSRIRGDANQLQQVLLNLIINAQQAISAHRGYGSVRILLAPAGTDRIHLAVEDDGPGVPESERAQIFRPFYTAKPSGQGTGLGLSICAEIVRAHGGTVWVDNLPDGGAAFRLELPSLAAADRARGEEPVPENPTVVTSFPAEPVAAPPDAPVHRLLLVDDEPGIRRSVGRFLGRCGYHVTDVPSAEAALKALESGHFDVIVSDIRMPGLSGEEFFAHLTRAYPDMVARTVFTSGDMLREETQLFLSASGRPALQKPYELNELLRVLARICPHESVPTRASA